MNNLKLITTNTIIVSAVVAPLFIQENKILLNVQMFAIGLQYLVTLMYVLVFIFRNKIKVTREQAEGLKHPANYFCLAISTIAAIVTGNIVLAFLFLFAISFAISLKADE